MIRVKIRISNPVKEIIENSENKIVLCIDSNSTNSLNEIKEIINKQYSKYEAKVDKITNEDGFLIIDNNCIWSYIKEDELLICKLTYLKKVIKTISYYNEVTKNDKNNSKRKLISSSSSSLSSSSSSSLSSLKNSSSVHVEKPHQKTQFLGKKTKSNQANSIKKKQIKKEALHKIEIDESKLTKIPSEKLDDLSYLNENHHLLFQKNTLLKFKMIELGDDGIEVSNYKIGKVLNYSEETNSLLVQLEDSDLVNSKTKLMICEDKDDDNDDNVICIQIKNFIEIFYYNPNQQNNQKKLQTEKVSEKNDKKEQPHRIEEINNNNNECLHNYTLNNDKESLAIPFIQRQIEYYFSNKNYYKDSYLLQSRDEEGCKFFLLLIF